MTRTLRSRRLALVAAATVTLSLVAGACGSEPRTTSGAGSTATAGPSTTIAPQVIVVSGSAGGAASAVPSASPEAATDSMDSKMIAALIHYSYEGAVPDLTGPAASWYFPAGVAVSEADVAAIAAALGVDGSPEVVPDDEGGGWRVGPADYSAPVVSFGTDAMQSWWYSGPVAPPAEPCAYYPPGDPAADASTADQVSCDEIEPPANVPDEAAARARAEELFASFGMDVADYELEAYADEWSAGVTAYLTVDGQRTWATASVGFGGDGVVTWASGFLAEPVRGGDYERIGVDAVIERLNEQSASWWGGGVLMDAASDTPVARSEDGVAVVPAEEAPAAPIDSTGTDVVVPDTDAVEPAPVEPEPIEVTLTGAEPSLEMIYAADGTVWLLPGYRFTTSDGGEITAPAVADEYLQYDDVEPLPVEEPMPVDVPTELTVPIVPTGTGEATTGETGSGAAGSGETGPLCAGLPTTITEPGISMAIADILVGMCVDDARAFVEGYQPGAALRVVREDGVDLAVTMDFSESRVNVATEGGVITEVVSIG